MRNENTEKIYECNGMTNNGMATNSYEKPATFGNIMRFAVPTIIMSIFTSVYTMVDGLFVSNLIGTDALSAINLVMPILGLITAISAMLATGGSALVMKEVGERRLKEARQDFTMLIIVNIVVGILMMILGFTFMNQIFGAMGIPDAVLGYCRDYLGSYLIFTVPVLLMYNFSLYLIASDKSRLSLVCSISGGITNMILDYVFIAVLDMGISGAAIATGLGYSITMIAGILVFSNKKNLLHFNIPVWRGRVLAKASSNGVSEMATSLVSGITTLMFNTVMLHFAGQNGVAAITIIMYVLMFATSMYMGYSYGVAPMISYYYGENNKEKLNRVVNVSIRFIGIVSVVTMIGAMIFAEPLVGIFTSPENPVYEMAIAGTRICSMALLFIGLNTFASGMFTALSNGLISAVLAFSRSFIFVVAAIQILPALLGLNGVWLTAPTAELMGIALATFFYLRYRKRYGYGGTCID